MTKTYNRDAYGLPSSLVQQVNRWHLSLTYSRHALTEALNDRYGVLPSTAFPQVFDMRDRWSLVEIETTDGQTTKIVVRRPVDDRRSLVLVITAQGLVKTLWTNLNSDNHNTLDKSKFSKP